MQITIRPTTITNIYRDNNGILLAQGGDALNNGTDSNTAQWIQPFGFASLPAPVANGIGAVGTLIQGVGKRDLIIGGYDTRTTTIYGNLVAGETCVYANVGQARILLKADSSINIYTSASDGGKAMVALFNPAADTITLLNSKGNGLLIGDTVQLVVSGQATFTLGSDGTITAAATSTCQIDGTTIVLGSQAAVPVVNSACFGPSGIVAIASTKVLIPL